MNLKEMKEAWSQAKTITRARLASPQQGARRGYFSVQEGVGILLAGIFAVIYLYFVAYAVPGALTAIATTSLTSVNPGVQTIFQVLFSIVAVFTFLLILVAVIQKVVAS